MGESIASPPKCFTPPWWLRGICFFGALAFPAAAYSLFREEGWSLLTIAVAALAPFSVAGFVDSLIAKVELDSERLVIVSNFRRREYSRALFIGASFGKGVPVALEYATGGWLRLPSFVPGGIGMFNILRAWLRRGQHAA